MTMMRRGEIWLACLDPVIGHELAKTRPVLIVSNDTNNQYAGTVTIVPVTSQKTEKIYPFEVFLPKGAANLPRVSKAITDHIRTLDKRRLIKRFGILEETTMDKVDQALIIHLNIHNKSE